MAVKTPQPNTATRIGILFIAGILLSASVAIPACARPPPPEYWAGYMLPQLEHINSSIRSEFTVTAEMVPEFPDLSPYHAYQNVLYEKTGDHYVSEVWYITDQSELSVQTARIKTYLASHGNVSDTTLDILPELAQFAVNPKSAEHYRELMNYYPVQNIPVLEYRSNVTSGYLVILPNHHYIAYYGRAGPFGPDDNSSIQKVLIMTAIPEHLEGEFGYPLPPWDHDSGLSLLQSPFFLLIVVSGLLITGLILVYMKKSGR